MSQRWDDSGIWEGFVPGVGSGALYKYRIASSHGVELTKGDPFARSWECPPKSASIVWDTHYEWGDDDWMSGRPRRAPESAPCAIYEVHTGSWRRKSKEGFRSLSYRELAREFRRRHGREDVR